nr:MAG TPA: terminase large subunit [Caudoviricetes sp.]DAT09878.1 MAG TPA: terminase large subunit [Caudoviricetes sp.]
MSPEQRTDYLKPFNYTSILKEEMLNLREENEGININLKQVNRGIRKDKFSAFEYGLYYIKHEEDDKKKRKRFNAKDWAFFN